MGKKPDQETTQLKTQFINLSNEYQNLLQQTIQYKELALKNALVLSNLARLVTSRLLEIETTDIEVQGKIMSIVKELNSQQAKKEEEGNAQSS